MSAYNQDTPSIPENLVLWLEKRIPVPFVPKLDADERQLQRLYGEWGLINLLRQIHEEQQNPTTYEDDVPDSEAT